MQLSAGFVDATTDAAESLVQVQLWREPGRRLAVRRGGRRFLDRQRVLVDSPSHHQAVERWESAEPVLVSLAEGLGVHREISGPPEVADHAVATLLAAANDVLLELEAERQKRGFEQAAFDNVWRGLE
ncbi:hypothetical protein [Streptomyces sp. NPDC060035]|uniref:hypothetical protein n=1 Tax=Streptomyces sp. NPDC060035 TaxID=3347044 RepID=UPI0036974618